MEWYGELKFSEATPVPSSWVSVECIQSGYVFRGESAEMMAGKTTKAVAISAKQQRLAV